MSDITAQTKFLYQLKKYGLRKFFLSPDFLVSIGIFVTLIICKVTGKYLIQSDTNYVIALFAAASTLFAITLAALAIILSFSNSEFMSFLRKKERLSSLLFLFWLGNSAYLFVLGLSVLYFIIADINIRDYIYIFAISMFVYSIINTAYLLATVIRFGYFIDIFENFKNRE